MFLLLDALQKLLVDTVAVQILPYVRPSMAHLIDEEFLESFELFFVLTQQGVLRIFIDLRLVLDIFGTIRISDSNTNRFKLYCYFGSGKIYTYDQKHVKSQV